MAEVPAAIKLKTRLASINTLLPSPEERAQVVWEILKKTAPDLTDWDVVCFAANYLGWQSQNIPWLEADAKNICRMIYTAHYLARDQNISTGLKDGRSKDTTEHQHTGTSSPREPEGERTESDVKSDKFE